MPLIAISILVQIACAVHCIRNGRSGLWLAVILLLSIPGCIAYAIFEILPQYSGRREVRMAKAGAARIIDPEREVRTAREALETADTAANRTALADALADRERWAEAIPHYREAVAKTPGAARPVRVRLARALLESGDPAEARAQLEDLPESRSQAENDLASLLLARTFEETEGEEPALALYAELGERMPGGEALCRRAALLLSRNRDDEAAEALVEVERRTKRIDPMERARHSEMYAWAARTLDELRERGLA